MLVFSFVHCVPTIFTLVDINDFIFVLQSQSSLLFLRFFSIQHSLNSLLQKMCMIRTPERFAAKINDLKDIVDDHIAGLEMVSLISIVYTIIYYIVEVKGK